MYHVAVRRVATSTNNTVYRHWYFNRSLLYILISSFSNIIQGVTELFENQNNFVLCNIYEFFFITFDNCAIITQ